jgi:hypothetical protein
MPTTLAKFPGQFPQTTVFPTNVANIAALYNLDANGNTSVGSDNLTANGTINHTYYGLFSKAANIICSNPASDFGGASYRKTSNASSWNWSSTKSYVIWHKHQTNCTHGQALWNYSNATTSAAFYTMFASSTGQYAAQMWKDGGAVSITFGSNVNWVNGADGKWHQIALVSESAASHKFYIDGVLHDYSTTSMAIAANNQVNIGALEDTFGMSGFVDEMAIFNRALTAKELHNYGGGIL